jgi:NAD(P)-dependent dehydrogenase (short-subunit alcohol dehydrogenase family)
VDIENRVVLVTGAAVRVGRAIALHLAARGAHIAFTYYEDTEPWQDTQAAIEALDREVLVRKVEIRAADQINDLVAAVIEKFGRIDILINNASVWLRSPLLEISETAWDLAMDVNLKGPFLLSQAAAPYMLVQEEGVIINITDLSAFQVWPEYAHHAASKAGLVSLTKSLAVELAPNIRVNAIAPGTVMLPDNYTAEKKQWAEEKSVLKRVGLPEDVAQLTEFLIENDFTTGSVYFVDGGRALV